MLLFATSVMAADRPGDETCTTKAWFAKTMLGADFDPMLLNDRVGFQRAYSIEDKGWLVRLEWKNDPNHGGGMGAFAAEDIAAGTLIRRSAIDAGGNFLRMQSYDDLASFCGLDNEAYSAERAALKAYVTDYLFKALPPWNAVVADEERVFGMWLPGCGDNCINEGEVPNVEDRLVEAGLMGMYATRDVRKGEPLLSDYDADFGAPPDWIAKFAADHLNGKTVFAGMNHNSAGWTPTLGG